MAILTRPENWNVVVGLSLNGSSEVLMARSLIDSEVALLAKTSVGNSDTTGKLRAPRS